MISNNVYYFDSGTSWVVPAGVTGIQVECFGSAFGTTSSSSSPLASNYSGGSYSKSNVTVTGGSTVYMNIGSLGGDTWFNTTNTAPTSSSSTSSACLAVGGNTVSASQIAANCGDTIYKGGNGLAVDNALYNTASGGQAGPNGNGADVTSYYTLIPWQGKISYMGGGANSGSSGSLGVPPYGRSGTGTVGSGGYWNGTVFIGTQFTNGGGFIDPVGQYSYVNGYLIQYSTGDLTNYGPTGGSVVYFYHACGCPDSWSLTPQKGFIVITLVYGRKFIVVVNTTGTTSFTAPSDFNSLVSVEAVGAGGNGDASSSGTNRYGGGGGGGYSKSTSVTTSITAGSTIIYANVAAAGGGTTASSWLNIGTSSAPTSNTTGVLAYSGGNGSTSTAGVGGTTTGAIGTAGSIFGGGNGGSGSTGTRLNAGGGGGSGGPLGVGGVGGAAYNLSTANRGAGGGGGANFGSSGGAGGLSASGTGGSSGGGGAGAAGNTAAVPGTIGVASTGPSGGGGGGGSGFSAPNNNSVGGAVNNSVYQIGGGAGGGGLNLAPSGIQYTNALNWPGAGGSGNSNSNNAKGGKGLVVFSYTPNAAPVVTTNGNFLAFF